MKLLKKSWSVVHTLLGFVQAHIALASSSVVGVSLAAGAESPWIDTFAEASSSEQGRLTLAADYQAAK